jgi:hypothetical protein
MSLEMSNSILTSCYRSYRDQIQHEDQLLNQRVTWIVMSQSFLLGTYAFLVNSPWFYILASGSGPAPLPGGPGVMYDLPTFLSDINLLRRVFQIVGLTSSIATCISAMAAVLAIRRLMRAYGRHMVLLERRVEGAEHAGIHTGLSPGEVLAYVSKIHEREGLPPLVTRRRYRVMGLTPTVFFGVVFAGAWLVLIFPARHVAAIILPLPALVLLALAGAVLYRTRARAAVRLEPVSGTP